MIRVFKEMTAKRERGAFEGESPQRNAKRHQEVLKADMSIFARLRALLWLSLAKHDNSDDRWSATKPSVRTRRLRFAL